jgi:hypothetical protein
MPKNIEEFDASKNLQRSRNIIKKTKRQVRHEKAICYLYKKNIKYIKKTKIEQLRGKTRGNTFLYILISVCYLHSGVSLWHFYVGPQCTLVRFMSTIISPHPSSPT